MPGFWGHPQASLGHLVPGPCTRAGVCEGSTNPDLSSEKPVTGSLRDRQAVGGHEKVDVWLKPEEGQWDEEGERQQSDQQVQDRATYLRSTLGHLKNQGALFTLC